jgi:acyl-CoA synthetase (AMP-forming)/AMP-acid ligase II
LNAARLFLGQPSGAMLTHVESARAEITRTWEELHRNVAGLSTSLLDLGIRPGDRLLILSNSRVEVIECILAAFSMGATAMPVGPTLGRTTLQAIVRRTAPACCVLEDVPDPEVLRALNDAKCVTVSLKGAQDAAASYWHTYRELIERGGRSLALPSFADEHPALIIHSSGSSGAPKVVVMSHGALVRYFECHNSLWNQYADSSDSLVATSAMVTGLPLHHLAGISTCLQGLLNGRSSYLMSFFLPHAYLKLLEKTRCASMLLVPSLYRSLLSEPYLRQMDRSALRCCILGGEPCSLELIRRIEAAFGVAAVMIYSMTECLSGIGHSRREIFENTIKHGSCGRQLFGELNLRDADGTVREDFGELWVRNATVHRCYLDPALNEARLRGGWFRTGDLFARDEDGDFFHRGRVDDMFICNGKNIYPLEMELLLLQRPGVEAVCAAPVTSRHKGLVPTVLVVTSQPLSRVQIQNHFRSNGPPHTVPQFVMFADALPLLGSGKTDRRQAASMLQAAYDAAGASDSPARR